MFAPAFDPARYPGEVVVSGAVASVLPLRHLEVQGQVVGGLASVALTQHFANPFNRPIEVLYRFAIPHRAALAGFEIRVGGRRIEGEIAARDEALRLYREALDAGRRAAVATEERPNLYTVQIGNLQPGEAVVASYRYSLSLDLDGGEFALAIPFAVTPRYHRADEPFDEVARTSVVVAGPGVPVASLDLSIQLDPGVPIEEPRSPSHRVQTTWLDERRAVVRLDAPDQPNRDFVLRYRVRADSSAVQSGAWRTATDDGQVVSALFVPPPNLDSGPAVSTEYVFVLDRSGSMSGEPIAQARNALRACLRTLAPDDTFRVLVFDNVVEWYVPSRDVAQPFDDRALSAADRFLAGVEGRGGTELIPALQAVLGLPTDRERRRVIVVLTDGAISAEDRVAELLAALLPRDRLFCFGIGPAVNRYLLDRLARLGRGVAEVVSLDEDIEDAIIHFQDRLGSPVLTDLTLEARGATLDETYPAPLPDLYAGQALRVIARLKADPFDAASPPVLILRGQRNGEPVTVVAEVPPVRDEPLVARQWGRARLDAVLETTPPDVEKIVALSRRYHLLTPFTALLAVDRVVVEGHERARRVIVAGAMPEGVTFGVVAHASRAAMPARRMQSEPADLDMPAFLRRRPGPPSAAPAGHRADGLAKAVPSADASTASPLATLIRAQRASGAWGDPGDSVVETALALVAFARAGQTPTRGSFRRPLHRALAWLRAAARQPIRHRLSWLLTRGGGPLDRLFLLWAEAEIAAAEGLPEELRRALDEVRASGDGDAELRAAITQRLQGLIDGTRASPDQSDDPLLAAILGEAWNGDTGSLSPNLTACLSPIPG